MKVFAISPKKFSERRVSITCQLEKLDLPYEYVDVTPAMIRSASLPNINLTTSEITAQQACAAAHLVAYSKIIEQGLKQALIVEDDVVFKSGFLNVLKEAAMINNEKGVISFYSANSQVGYFSCVGSKCLSNGRLYYPLDPMYFRSGVAYLIGRKAAASILEVNGSLDYVADNWYEFYVNSSRGSFDSLMLHYPFAVDFSYEKSSLGYKKNKFFEISENAFSRLPGFLLIAKLRRKAILWKKRSNIKIVKKESLYFPNN